MVAFGLFGTPADAGATYTPASVTTVPPRLTHDPQAKPLARSIPVTIRIPGIYVDAPVMEVGLNTDGSVQVPPLDDHNLTGLLRPGMSAEPVIDTKATVLAEREPNNRPASHLALARSNGG